MKTRRHFLPLAFVVMFGILAGCGGAPRTTVIVSEEVTSILLVGNLLGGTVQLSNGFSRTIVEDDLQKSITNIYSVNDSPDQKLQRVTLNVDPGETMLSFERSDGSIFKKRLYVSPGITTEVRIN